MSRGRSGRRTAVRRREPVILVFGENLDDAQSIEALLSQAEPALAGRLRSRPKPVSLTRTAQQPAVRKWIDSLAGVVAAMERSGSPVQAVVVHRDADGPDANGSIQRQLASQLSTFSSDGHAVVPVQELEAWWFLYPDAVEAIRPQLWRGALRRAQQDVEKINNPKEELQRRTRSRHGHAYQEADAPAIARYVREHSPRRHGTSASCDRLRATASALIA